MEQLFYFNLQLFAGEKTEQATPRRKEDARKKGQVAKSSEIVSVIVLTLTLLILRWWMPTIIMDFQTFFTYVLKYSQGDLTQEKTFHLISETLLIIGKMMAPIVLTAMVAGYMANVVQIGFLFTTEPLKFDLTRLSPISGVKRIVSKRAIAELVKSLGKIILVGYVAFSYLWKRLPELMVLMDVPLITSMQTFGSIIISTCWRVLAILLIIAVADYAYQLYEYEESLKMSKQEIKDEYKNIEGDPQLKSKIKERQRQLATRRMMEEVPKSTVVITNPTHFAVAVKYEDDMDSPIVVAKGQDLIAFKIREIAEKNQVTVVENQALARLLFKRVDIGLQIPVDLYQAVAEVIAYVYKLKKTF